jgi:uncharacterized protein YlzI (FlbEa/FlbD family)
MIPVTPTAGLTILLDVDTVAAIESTPETVIVFTDGRRMLVSDSADALVRRIARCRSTRIARNADPHVLDSAPEPGDVPHLGESGV